jgi:hypothetical protein
VESLLNDALADDALDEGYVDYPLADVFIQLLTWIRFSASQFTSNRERQTKCLWSTCYIVQWYGRSNNDSSRGSREIYQKRQGETGERGGLLVMGKFSC